MGTEARSGPGTNAVGTEARSGPGTNTAGTEARSESDLSRRDFLTRAGRATVGATAIGITIGGVRFAIPNVEAGRHQRLALGLYGDFKIGTVTWLRDHELFITRSDEGFGAFSSRCTHLGCTVRRVAEGFLCPCHGAKYDARGLVVEGPARKPLPWYQISLGPDGKLWLRRDRPVEPGTFVPASTREDEIDS